MNEANHKNPDSGRHRVLIVGLDGATFDVILPMIEQGRLPVLARLLESGAWGELLSTLPPLSPIAWSSFLTGKNPGRHGVFGFEEVESGSYNFRPVAATRLGHRTLWRIASEHGRRVMALDIPFSYPPEPVNGLLVAGYGAPTGEGRAFTYPHTLRDEMARRFGRFPVAVPSLRAAPPCDALFRQWDQILDNRSRVADYLIRTNDWDVFMIVLGVTDHIQHGTWTYYEPLHPDSRSADAPRFREALFQYYEKTDTFIGRLLDGAGGSLHIVVLSDHGFGTTWRGQLTRRLLVEGGWLRYRGWSGAGARMMDLAHRAYDAAPWLKRLLHRRPADRFRLKRAVARAVDWRRTVAFPAAMGWQVFINARGAFPFGAVEPGMAYDALCREIKERLENSIAPRTDQRLIRRVWHRDEVFHGEAIARAPDLLVEYANLHGAKLDGGAGDWDLVGSHAMNGIFIASGPEIGRTHLEGARIFDVTPTVLHLMNLPIPGDLDGRVLCGAFRPEALSARPIQQEAPAAVVAGSKDEALLPEEAESVREQLRNLGYLD
jgi:predicted AlkP superfamily phosphohydrolase/phosphomutase